MEYYLVTTRVKGNVRPSLEQVGDTTGSTDLYWKDHDGSSYLVTAQNVGAYSSQALDDGNIAFVYAVHLGTEWHLNYRVFDPSSKSFLTEETTIASNVYAEAIGGQYISVNITALGSGGFSAVLETGAPDHTVLKYSEVSNTSSGYNSSEGSNVRPSLEQVGDTTGSTDLYWKDHDGSSYLVTAQNVGAYSVRRLMMAILLLFMLYIWALNGI